METIFSIKPLLTVLVSLFVIPILVSSSDKPNVRESWIFIAGTIKLLLVLSMLPIILEGKTIGMTLFEIAPGANIAFRVDGLGMLFAIVASSLYIVTSIYSIGYMRGLKEHGQTRFVSFFAIREPTSECLFGPRAPRQRIFGPIPRWCSLIHATFSYVGGHISEKCF